MIEEDANKNKIPKDCYITFTLPEEDREKLQKWLAANEAPEVAISNNGGYLINEAELAKRCLQQETTRRS